MLHVLLIVSLVVLVKLMYIVKKKSFGINDMRKVYPAPVLDCKLPEILQKVQHDAKTMIDLS